MSFFFEEDAFAEDGSLRQAKALSINKIGHGEGLQSQVWQMIHTPHLMMHSDYIRWDDHHQMTWAHELSQCKDASQQ